MVLTNGLVIVLIVILIVMWLLFALIAEVSVLVLLSLYKFIKVFGRMYRVIIAPDDVMLCREPVLLGEYCNVYSNRSDRISVRLSDRISVGGGRPNTAESLSPNVRVRARVERAWRSPGREMED